MKNGKLRAVAGEKTGTALTFFPGNRLGIPEKSTDSAESLGGKPGGNGMQTGKKDPAEAGKLDANGEYLDALGATGTYTDGRSGG